MAESKHSAHSGAYGCCGSHGERGEGTPPGLAVDPVCGMAVDPQQTAHHATHAGQAYHFCSAGCHEKFAADPERYLSKSATPAAGASLGAIWTCPMHPEIRQDHPGACPICGMGLEPELVTADAGPSAELIDMSRRFWIALALALPVFILEMGSHLFPALHHLVPMKLSTWIQFALATPVVLWAGWPFLDVAGPR